jgi:hypothetical protein
LLDPVALHIGIQDRMWVDNTEFRFGREQAANPTIKAITVVAA